MYAQNKKKYAPWPLRRTFSFSDTEELPRRVSLPELSSFSRHCSTYTIVCVANSGVFSFAGFSVAVEIEVSRRNIFSLSTWKKSETSHYISTWMFCLIANSLTTNSFKSIEQKHSVIHFPDRHLYYYVRLWTQSFDLLNSEFNVFSQPVSFCEKATGWTLAITSVFRYDEDTETQFNG